MICIFKPFTILVCECIILFNADGTKKQGVMHESNFTLLSFEAYKGIKVSTPIWGIFCNLAQRTLLFLVSKICFLDYFCFCSSIKYFFLLSSSLFFRWSFLIVLMSLLYCVRLSLLPLNIVCSIRQSL